VILKDEAVEAFSLTESTARTPTLNKRPNPDQSFSRGPAQKQRFPMSSAACSTRIAKVDGVSLFHLSPYQGP